MEADGLVERRPDPSDRRARRLYLTSKATPFLDTMWHLADLTRAEAFEGHFEKGAGAVYRHSAARSREPVRAR